MKPQATSPHEARRALAEAIRQLASGTITQDQFEDRYCALADTGHTGDEMFEFAWSFYDDFYTHRLRGSHRLSRSQRRVFARCVLFLRSGIDYQWPKRAKWLWCKQSAKVEPSQRLPWWKPDADVISSIPIIGWIWAKRLRNRIEEEADRLLKAGPMVDDRIWPFRTMAEYKAALARPFLLAGPSHA